MPAGKPVYLSDNAVPEKILHDEAGASEVLVPVGTGQHELRLQTLSSVRIWPLLGALSIPPSTYPLSTSAAETTIGLPPHVRPLAVVGGDRVRWAFGRGDLVAVGLGIALACMGFRTRRTRVLGALGTAGLWFVSREAFVVAGGALGVASAIFLASRFLRGTRLLVASGLIVSAGMLVARAAMPGEPLPTETQMTVVDPKIPTPETRTSLRSPAASPADVTPVSLSMPTSERYVRSSRQVVSRERPFVPRVLYVTSTLVAALHVGWLALALLLVFAHKDALAALKAKISARLSRRSDEDMIAAAEIEVPPL